MKIKNYLSVLLACVMCFCMLPQNITAAENVTFTAIAGTESNSNEGYAKLFDGSADSNSNKWCVNLGENGAYVIIKASKQVIVTEYTLTTGNDNAGYGGRNPKSWELSGCNDYDEADENSGSWNTIDKKTDNTTMQDKNKTPYSFSCENTNAYQYYKLKVTAVQGAENLLQIGEMSFTYEDPNSVSFTALDGKQTSTGEGYAKLIDGNINTKWGVGNFSGAYIVIKASKKIYVREYTFTTGNDTDKYPGRNPEKWTLFACNDYDESSKEGAWTPIHTVTQDTVLRGEKQQTFNFVTDINNVAYQYYKLEITANVDGDFMQLSEMEFIYDLCGHSWEVVSVTEASCTEPEYTSEHCDKCNSERTIETAPALGHQFGDDGKCIRCGELCAAEVNGKYYTDLQTAVNESANESTIVMRNNAEIKNTLSISKNITLDLNGCTLTMTGSGSVIQITGNGSLNLEDSSGNNIGKITGGNATANGGGVYIDKGTFNMTGGTISGCQSDSYGGGVYVDDDSVFNMTGGIISDCTAKNFGGGVYVCGSGKITMDNGHISDCHANTQVGGGIYFFGGTGSYTSERTVKNSHITGCTAVRGGGIYVDGGNVTISGTTVEDCTATSDQDWSSGGGVYVDGGTTTINEDTVIYNNHAPKTNGGGLGVSSSGTVIADGITVSKNDAINGAGICVSPFYSNTPSLKLTNSDITNNTSTGDGGGIWLQSTKENTITDSTISDNSAAGNGGGVMITNSGSPDDLSLLKLSNNTIKSNNAANGGGMYVTSSNFTAEGGDIFDNNAQNGGGIWVSGISVMKMIYENIKENKATIGGGMYLSDDNVSVTMDRVTVMGNTATEESGGISCKTGGIDINGGAQIYHNFIAAKADSSSETKEIQEIAPSNLCLYDGKTIAVTVPETEMETGYFSSMIGVSVIGDEGSGCITSSYGEQYSDKYDEFFYADNNDCKIVYNNGAVYMGIKVFADYGNGEFYEKGVLKNGTLELEDPERTDYFFGGWFVDGNGYDFKKPVTESFTVTAKWLKEGENAVSITPQKVYVTTGDIEGKLYIAAYKDGSLTNVKAVDSKPGFAFELSKLGLEVSAADELSAFLWDSKMHPLCESAGTLIK